MIGYEKMLAMPARTTHQVYDHRDTILYALSVGAGLGDTDYNELPFVYEKDLRVIPTMAAVLGWPGFWLDNPVYEVDWKKALHGDHSIEVFKLLPSAADIRSVLTIDEIYDKGEGRGALLRSRRDIFCNKTGDLLAREIRGTFLRGDGGCGGSPDPAPAPAKIPEDRAPDHVVTLPTLDIQALLYRLGGDNNPLHVDPEIARAGGFDRPILHGLCTYGIAGRALLATLCDNRTENFRKLDVRFSSPVYPGETIRTEIWKQGEGEAVFRSAVVERDITVLNNGYFQYRYSSK